MSKRPPPDQNGMSGPIVAVGGSAGAAEVWLEVLRQLPPATGLTFVLLAHRGQETRLRLPDMLQAATDMEVVEARDGALLQPNRLYCVPPEAEASFSSGRLRLRQGPGVNSHRFDELLDSLAEYAEERAIGIVLSGTGSDGAEGVRRLKARGGTTIAQQPETAAHPGMPASAILTGMVDFVLSPGQIAELLVRFARSPVMQGDESDEADDQSNFVHVLGLLERCTGVDFTCYKPNTLRRRIRRRMVLHGVESLGEYARLLEARPAECDDLYADLLIQVTSLFRDPDLYAALQKRVLPQLLADRTDREPIRIWVPGCATGEEVYSLAILMQEERRRTGSVCPVQIFGTDLSDSAITRARTACFPESIRGKVPADLLERYFTPVDKGYKIAKDIRGLCIFARQDVTKDPPFSHVDLISCRNLLIYLTPAVHQRVLRVFHSALSPGGYLVLGQSETVGRSGNLFSLVERRHKIYVRRPTNMPAVTVLPPQSRPIQEVIPIPQGTNRSEEPRWNPYDIQREADRLMLARFSPPGVVVDDELEVVQVRGRTGRYLEPAPGTATHNLLKMARKGLLVHLRAAIQQARSQEVPVRKQGIRVQTNGDATLVDLEILPLYMGSARQRYYLVLFDESPYLKSEEEEHAHEEEAREARSEDPSQELLQLQQELAATREYLNSIIEEREAANEELTAASEEIQSANEELQSANEELETAKEELQATNEELTTVNEELHERNLELTRANNDLKNLLATFSIPVLILGPDLTIRRFTPMVERLINVIPGDIGRPIAQIRPNIEVPGLEERVTEVIDTLVPVELEARDRDGRWYSVRIRPYRTSDNVIEGAIVVFVDIDEMRRALDEAQAAGRVASGILESVNEAVAVLDCDFQVRQANAAFLESAHVPRGKEVGRSLASLWKAPELEGLAERMREQPDGRSLDLTVVGPGGRPLRLRLRHITDDHGFVALVEEAG